jgi:hypothetical protein
VSETFKPSLTGTWCLRFYLRYEITNYKLTYDLFNRLCDANSLNILRYSSEHKISASNSEIKFNFIHKKGQPKKVYGSFSYNLHCIDLARFNFPCKHFQLVGRQNYRA